MRNRFATVLLVIATPSLASATTATFDMPGLLSPVDVLSFSNGAVQPGLPSDFNMTIPATPDAAKFELAVATGQHVADGTLNLLSTSFVSETRVFTDLVFTRFAPDALTDTDAITFAYDTVTITLSQPTLTISGLSAATIGVPLGLTATLLDGNGQPIVGDTIDFAVQSGPDAGVTGVADTNAMGMATFSYTGTAPGADMVAASIIFPDVTLDSNLGEVDWSTAAPVPVPEPASMLLFGTGLIGVGAMRRWRTRRQRD